MLKINIMYGIGCDIVQKSRISIALERNEKFSQKILTKTEIDIAFNLFPATKNKQINSSYTAYCAKIFAAKEAFSKAMGTGIHPPFSWLDIEILKTEMGKPYINLTSPEAKLKFSELGCKEIHLTISDEKEYAMAVALVT